MKTCGMSTIKYFLFIFNLVFAITGIIIIAVGAVVLANTKNYNKVLDPAMVGLSVVLIVIGASVFLISSIGCFGAVRESFCLLITFSVCLLIVFLMEIGVGIASAAYENDFIQGLNETVKAYSSDTENKQAWDAIHKEFKCCGINGPITWQGQNVPDTCCHNDESLRNSAANYCVERGVGKYLYEIGCLDKINESVKSNARLLIGVGIGIAFVEVAGIVLACLLAFRIKKEDADDEKDST